MEVHEKRGSEIKRMERIEGKLMLQGAEDGVEGVGTTRWTLAISEETGRAILTASGEEVAFVVFVPACRFDRLRGFETSFSGHLNSPPVACTAVNKASQLSTELVVGPRHGPNFNSQRRVERVECKIIKSPSWTVHDEALRWN